MSKYYKKPHKKSLKFYGASVSYPNHKTSYNGWSKHTNKRKVKKFEKYRYHNEELFELLFDKVQNYKAIPINTHWHSLRDAYKETSESDEWLYVIDNEESYSYETTEWKASMKPRWRSFINEEIKQDEKDVLDYFKDLKYDV